jgi:hypothetical protein
MDRQIKISVSGDDYVSEVIRDSLHTIHSIEIIYSDDLRKSDIIYWVGGKGPSIKKNFLSWIKKDPLIINHWIGSDVLGEMEKNQKPVIRQIGNIIQNWIFHWKGKRGGLINFAGAPWLVDELSKLKISAIYLPITTIDAHKLGTVDNQHVKDIDFLSYVPFSRFEFYGGDKIVNLAERWQNYTFLLIFSDLNEIPPDLMGKMPKNVIISPRVERNRMPEFYQRSKFFIRYTQHDSESLSVFEALYYNLQILWTYDFPFTHKIETFEKLSDSLPSLVESWQPNYDGHTYVIEHFSIDKWREDFSEIIISTIHQKLKHN